MPVLPQSLLVLGASFLTTRTSRRLKRARSAVPAQRAAFRLLLRNLAATEQGRACGLSADMTGEAFRARVPVRTHAQYAGAIERMKRGQADVLWPGRCALYALSSGTTDGTGKWLPVTAAMVAHFRRAGLAALLFYTARVGHCGVFRGRHLFLGGSTPLAPLAGTQPFGAFGGDLSGLVEVNLPGWARQHLHEPGMEIARMDDWPKKLEAIVARTRHVDIALVAGLPGSLLELGDVLRQPAGAASPPGNVQALWPNLECLVHGGLPLAPFHDELRRTFGPAVNFHEVYVAAEAFIAAQDAEPSAGLRLIDNGGVYFEFLPLADFDEGTLGSAGPKAVPLEQVRAGVDYVLLLTTPAGLCRYVVGDVVRFTSVEPPRLVCLGRTQLQLNAFAEHVVEQEVTEALVGVCRRHGWSIMNFHVAPVFMNSLTGQKRGRHEWWIELRPGTVATPTGPLLATELDRELMARNADYAARRRAAAMEAPLVRLVMPGFFDHWMKHQGRWASQHKLPRCRSDRQIADDLTALACFNPD